MLVACEECKIPFVDESELVTHFTREELKVIAGILLKDWRVYVIAGVCLVVGVGLLYWQAREHIKTQIEQFRVTVSNQVVTAYSTATNQLAHQFRTFAQDASNQVAQAYSSVTNQIAEEFQTPRIKQIVENVAKSEAKSILEGEVQPVVYSFRDDALFIRTIARAQAYDFKAYQRLLEIAMQTNDNAQLANQVVAEIDRSLQRNRTEILGKRMLGWVSGTNMYGGPFTSDEMALWFPRVMQDRTSLNREGFVNAVRDLKQLLFLPRLIECFTNETDLVVADRLAMAISDLAKEDFHPHGIKQIQTWWHLHKNEYTNWPFSELESGLDRLVGGRYSEAADSFQRVLKLDPSADVSRALAIASCLEIGETNQASELAKRFKEPTARWAEWASAMTDLHTGNISNATVQFADLTRKNPTMIVLPQEGLSFWSKIDWQLFHKLTSTEKP